MTTTLILGGVRSGKSRLAEKLLLDREDVTYVATGPGATSRDEEWAQRVKAHQERRPESWDTLETTDLTRAIMGARGPLLIDCLGNWVTSLIDEADAWDDYRRAVDGIEARLEEVLVLWIATQVDIVAVSNEVGSGVVPASQSGRVFRDVMGMVNAKLGAASSKVYLCVAGRALDLSDTPII